MESSAKENQVWFEAETGQKQPHLSCYVFFFPTCITYLETPETRGVSQIPYLSIESLSAQTAFTLQMPYWWNRRSGVMTLACSLTLVSDSELTYPSLRRRILIKHDGSCVINCLLYCLYHLVVICPVIFSSVKQQNVIWDNTTTHL